MSYTEWIDVLRVLLPNAIALLFITGVLGAGVLAVRTSPKDPPADRHFVLLLSLCGVSAVFVMGLLIRLLPNTKPVGDLLTSEPLLLGLAGAWLLGFMLVVTRLMIGWLALAGLQRRAEIVRDDDPIMPVLRQCARHLGLRTMPRVVFSRRCRSPLAVGIIAPRVILPAALREADETELRMVVIHEFAHIRRRDCLAQLLVQLIGSLLWWNPVYWIAAGDLRVLREMVCDEIVATGCPDAKRYAALLVHFAERAVFPFGPGFAAVRMAERSSLHVRIEWMLRERKGFLSHIPRIFPSTMTSRESVAFLLFAVFVAVCCDAMIMSMLEELMLGFVDGTV